MTKTLKFSLLLIAAFALSSCGWFAGVSITGVELSEGTLTPEFDEAVTEYTATVAHTTSSVDITVASDNPDLGVTINDTDVLPGTGTASIALAAGDNTVTIIVSDGEESVTYTVVVTRLSAPEIVVIGKANYDDTTEIELVSGSTVDFGSIPSDRDLTFTIENAGSTPLSLTGGSGNLVVVTNNDGAYYSVLTPPDSDTIPAGGSTTFVVRFESLYESYGTKTATLSIENDDDDEGTYTLSLTGLANCG
jgi:large repetitive protein